MFVIALATILVMEVVATARFDQRAARAFAEEVQGNFALRSVLHFGTLVLDVPKLPNANQQGAGAAATGARTDSFSDLWAQVEGLDPLPIDGLPGKTRLAIVDESGKVDLNALVATSDATTPPAGQTGGAATPTQDRALIWKKVTSDLLGSLGFTKETYPANSYRTIGNVAFDGPAQVAVLTDWIDRDRSNYSGAGFPAQGIESSAKDSFTYRNRPLLQLQELLAVPGFTLDRFQRACRYVRTSSGRNPKININTTPFEVLVALGLPQGLATDIVKDRLGAPIAAMPPTIPPEVSPLLQFSSNEFSILVRMTLPNGTRWARALVVPNRGSASAGAGGIPKLGNSQIRFTEFF